MSVGNNAYLAFGTIGIAAYSLKNKDSQTEKERGGMGENCESGIR